MNYLYDILLNFNSKLFDVFEWNKSDDITHVRKIPVFKISSDDMYILLCNKVELSSTFLSKIFKKTEYFMKNRIGYVNYAFLVTDGKEVVALKCNNKIVTGYSKLLYDEEDDVLEYSNHIKLEKIEYKVIHKLDIDFFKTRNEIYIRKYILRELNKMIGNNDIDKLTYLYLECFDNNTNNVKEKIYRELDNNWDETYFKVYNFLKKILSRH